MSTSVISSRQRITVFKNSQPVLDYAKMFADLGHLHQLRHCSALLAEEAKYVFFAARAANFFRLREYSHSGCALGAEGRDLRENESVALVARAQDMWMLRKTLGEKWNRTSGAAPFCLCLNKEKGIIYI
jgi:hypothetical protein